MDAVQLLPVVLVWLEALVIGASPWATIREIDEGTVIVRFLSNGH